MPATTVPTRSSGPKSPRASTWTVSSRAAPAMAGRPSMKVSRADSTRLMPWASPAVMVIPERLIPGMRAIACAIPTTMASLTVPSSTVRSPGRSRWGADDRRRDGADDEQHPHPPVVRAARGSHHPDQFTAVIPEKGDQGAEVQHRGGGEIGFVEIQQRRHQDEVGARRHRKELGEALDEPPDDGGEHRRTIGKVRNAQCAIRETQCAMRRYPFPVARYRSLLPDI